MPRSISPDEHAAARRMAARGRRLTPQRRAVLDALLGSDRYLTAAQVHVEALKACPSLGLMTVYRTLELLVEVGAVRRLHASDRCDAYAPAAAGHGHTVVCTACGRVSEFTRCDLGDVAMAAARETGFRIEGHFLQFSGTCAACRLKGQPSA
jgi:Fe2+ or Zn2+ uptake regulation protein